MVGRGVSRSLIHGRPRPTTFRALGHQEGFAATPALVAAAKWSARDELSFGVRTPFHGLCRSRPWHPNLDSRPYVAKVGAEIRRRLPIQPARAEDEQSGSLVEAREFEIFLLGKAVFVGVDLEAISPCQSRELSQDARFDCTSGPRCAIAVNHQQDAFAVAPSRPYLADQLLQSFWNDLTIMCNVDLPHGSSLEVTRWYSGDFAPVGHHGER